MTDTDDEQLGPFRRCTCASKTVCVNITWDASKGYDGSTGAVHSLSEELTYRSFQLDPVRGSASSDLFAAVATAGATWLLLDGHSSKGGHWRSDCVFLAVLGLAASALATLRIVLQALQRRRFPLFSKS